MPAASPPPLCRGLVALLAVCGAAAANRVDFLAAGLLVVLAILWAQGSLGKFAKFVLTVIVPVGLGLIIVWGLIRKGAPTQSTVPSVQAGVHFAVLTTLRLGLLSAVFLAAVFSLPTERLVDLLRAFGIRHRILAIIVSTLNLWPDFRRQVEQVFAGRCARGLMRDRRFTTRASQFPFVLRTLFVSALGQGIDRADSWESSGLLDRLDTFSQRSSSPKGYSRVAGYLWLALAITWATLTSIHIFIR
jgi:hypothetical protein